MSDKFDLNNISGVTGLSEKEASDRLAREGFNEIPSAKKRSIISFALSVLRGPMLLLLIATGILYFSKDPRDLIRP